ncbi:MAG: glycosyltransferase family 2 protein [Acidimicrobiales bacterium]
MDEPKERSVPVSVVVLTKDEEANIIRCLRSVAWAEQVVVLDSGSTDSTVALAEKEGATVLHRPWLGFGAQRQYALDHSGLRHEWVHFVDADEWVSRDLAVEVASSVSRPEVAGFAYRRRLVFMGRWIRHCGWYANSWVVVLARREATSVGEAVVGERLAVKGRVERLTNDIVDEDRKGLAAWLRKHVHYAELEAARRATLPPFPGRLRAALDGEQTQTLSRALAKEIFLHLPAKPLIMFIYMYILRKGFLDGQEGFAFCVYHAWHEYAVGCLAREMRSKNTDPEDGERSISRIPN